MTLSVHPNAETAIQAGSEAPDFTLADQNGVSRRLQSQVGQGLLVLVFYRGDW